MVFFHQTNRYACIKNTGNFTRTCIASGYDGVFIGFTGSRLHNESEFISINTTGTYGLELKSILKVVQTIESSVLLFFVLIHGQVTRRSRAGRRNRSETNTFLGRAAQFR